MASESSTSSRFGDATPFKVQVYFDIPLFEGKIDEDALDNSLNVLDGYFSVHNFFDRENITFTLHKVVPHVQNWWGNYWEQNSSDESRIFETNTNWGSFVDVIKEQYSLWENMMNSTPNGPFFIKIGTRRCQSTPTTFIPYT